MSILALQLAPYNKFDEANTFCLVPRRSAGIDRQTDGPVDET